MQTNDLIASLSREATKRQPLHAPLWLGLRLILVLSTYGVIAQFFMHIRPDVIAQFSRAPFTIEIALLFALFLSSVFAAVVAMYPDYHQKTWILSLPYLIFAVVAGFILYQMAMMPVTSLMVIPPPGGQPLECALCIAALSMIPSAFIFGLMRRGASVTPIRAGSFAVLGAASLGSLILRLAEPNDSLLHLAQWHYLPTLLFAVIGAFAGKWLLKW